MYLVFCLYTSRPTSLVVSDSTYLFALCYLCFQQYINIISVDQKLIFYIQFQSFPNFLDLPDGIF